MIILIIIILALINIYLLNKKTENFDFYTDCTSCKNKGYYQCRNCVNCGVNCVMLFKELLLYINQE